MSDRHRWLQEKAKRKHALPIVRPTAGGPLIKSTPNLGWMLETRKGRVPLDMDFPNERRKAFLFSKARQFIEEERRIDGAVFMRGSMKVHGPFPHFDPHEADIQKGTDGVSRPVARSVEQDTSDNGMEDYVLEATFRVPEYINEIPTSLAKELFSKPGGRPGLRPLRGMS